MINNTNDSGVSPVIGVILLVAVFTGLVIILSFNLFASDYATVTESIDADIDIEEYETGIIINLNQNENIDKLIVKHEDGDEKEINTSSLSSTDVEFGPGKYYVIGQLNEDTERLLSHNTIYNQILNIDIPDTASTNQDIEYAIDTNFNEDEIESYEWDLGDGTTSNESEPSHSYSSSGTYNVNITIFYDDEEITNEKTINIDSNLPNPEEPDDKRSIIDNMDGEGTESDPYIIRDDHDLQSVYEELDANYKLGQNINASKTNNWYDEKGFDSLGNDSQPFTGSIDGDGYTIEGITINRSSTSQIGLISTTNVANINNISMQDTNITGQSDVGGLVGKNINSEISNSNVEGEIIGQGNLRVGGLIGYNTDTSILENSFANIYIENNDGSNTGGLVGKNEESIVTRSYSTGTISSTENINVGGLVGVNTQNSEIKSSYSLIDMDIVDNTRVGGVLGYNEQGILENTYYAGMIESDGIKGGLVGKNEDISRDSYWDEEKTEIEDGIGDDSEGDSSEIINLDTEDMQGDSAETNMTELDFEDIWMTVEDEYPILQWDK